MKAHLDCRVNGYKDKDDELEEEKITKEERERINRLETQMIMIFDHSSKTLNMGSRRSTECKLNRKWSEIRAGAVGTQSRGQRCL